jgi:DNA repair protein RadC
MDRPRGKLRYQGAQSLSDEELLAILLVRVHRNIRSTGSAPRWGNMTWQKSAKWT